MRDIKGNLIRGHFETMVLEESELHGLPILRRALAARRREWQHFVQVVGGVVGAAP